MLAVLDWSQGQEGDTHLPLALHLRDFRWTIPHGKRGLDKRRHLQRPDGVPEPHCTNPSLWNRGKRNKDVPRQVQERERIEL